MERFAEIPDAHVLSIAAEFCEAAEILLEQIPNRVIVSPLRCNAALAVELFIKSLDSRWELEEIPEIGEGAFAITTRANIKGHRLDNLFRGLPPEMQEHINSSFGRHFLRHDYENLDAILRCYASSFVSERYPFEHKGGSSRPIREIVDLARFFRDTVTALPRVRV